MGDFYQNGIITTLHNLADRPLEDMERELQEFSSRRPMALILPSLYSELEGEALPRIVDELVKVPYLSEIVIGLDRADDARISTRPAHAFGFHRADERGFGVARRGLGSVPLGAELPAVHLIAHRQGGQDGLLVLQGRLGIVGPLIPRRMATDPFLRRSAELLQVGIQLIVL